MRPQSGVSLFLCLSLSAILFIGLVSVQLFSIDDFTVTDILIAETFLGTSASGQHEID